MKVQSLYTAEINDQEWLEQFKRKRLCLLLSWSGAIWLRLLILRPLCNETGLYFCSRCGVQVHPVEEPNFHRVCPACDSYALPLNDVFWSLISNRIRRAQQQNRLLIEQTKRDLEDWPSPEFRTPLDWINEPYRKAKKRPGRRSPRLRWLLMAVYVDFLTTPCVVVSNEPKGFHIQKVGRLVPRRRVSEVLEGNLAEKGRMIRNAKGHSVSYGDLSLEERKCFSEMFANRAKALIGKEIKFDEREIRRAIRWFKEHTNVLERVFGRKAGARLTAEEN